MPAHNFVMIYWAQRNIRSFMFASMWKRPSVFIGLLIAFFAIAIDDLLPGISLGVNLPRLLLIAAGLTLAGFAMLTQREIILRYLAGRRRRTFTIAAILTVLTLLAIELALALGGVSTYYSTEPPDYRLSVSNWWTCDAAGCRYVHDAVLPACESGELEGRVCAVNQQGYSDTDNFAWREDFEDKIRVLLIGDSVTYGMSADVGWSFAEKLDADLPETVIWNTGIPGGGTHQALAAFNVYAPILRPHLTILAFVTNDFDDNLLPIDSWLNAIDPNGKAVAIRMYEVDYAENVIPYEVSDIEYFQTYWKFPPANEFERQLGLSRLGALLLRLIDALEAGRPTDARFDRRDQVTREYLQELRDIVREQGSAFLLLLVPGPADISRPGMRYQLARDIVNSLAIAHIDPIARLEVPADYAPLPDDHWSNAGHQKVGAMLVDCINEFIASGDFSDCAHVTMPRN